MYCRSLIFVTFDISQNHVQFTNNFIIFSLVQTSYESNYLLYGATCHYANQNFNKNENQNKRPVKFHVRIDNMSNLEQIKVHTRTLV